ncbi:MAG: hypothetical protein MUF44_03635 [Hydrogenophaga sp.]|jgi:hypothetical protein|nr:hypothetical protein [Hydrogenophaga sp.]
MLDLDPINPRTNPEADQTTAMRSLIEVERDGEKIYALAQNICQMGTLDPGDRLYTVASTDDPDRYIVLDGNRRLTALRLLSQPGLLDRDDIGLSTSLRQRFKRLQKEYPGRWPTNVDVVVYANRDSAAPFIRLRHTGENAGAGRSAWSALQIARFDNSGVWQCLKQLRDESALDLSVVNQLDRSEFPITNFDRVAGTLEFQTRFGISLGVSSFSITGPKPRAVAAMARLASDVANGRVDSRGEFAEAARMPPYFDEIEQAITPPPAPAPTPSPAPSPGSGGGSAAPWPSSRGTAASATGTPAAPSPPASPPAPPPASPTPRKPRETKYLIDKRDLTTITNAKCRAIVDELKTKVPVAQAPYACALLLRSLQEMTAELYLEAYGLPKSNKAANITSAANHLLGNSHPTDPANRMALATSFKTSSTTYQELCEAAHSTLSSVSTDHVRTTWKNLGGGMDLLWKRIHAKITTPPAS